MTSSYPTPVSSDVYFSTLDLLQSIRNGDQQAFDQLLPHSDVCAMDHAAIHVAVQCKQKHMLTILLATLSGKISNPQSLVWAIANDNYDVIAELLPNLNENCIAIGLKDAENCPIIDLIDPYITQVDNDLLLHLCEHNRMYSLHVLKDKINRKSIKKTLIQTLKSNNLPAAIFLLDNFDDMFMHYDGNLNNNILACSVNCEMDTLREVARRCSKDMYYGALVRAVSFEKNEQSLFLLNNHMYTNDEIIEIFSICCKHSDTQLGEIMVKQYPVLQERCVELISCSVRDNNQELFNQLLQKVDDQNADHIDFLYGSAMAASRKNYIHYLIDMATIIDLDVALQRMSEINNVKDEHMDGLRTVIAQQQNQTIASHIKNLGPNTRRKM